MMIRGKVLSKDPLFSYRVGFESLNLRNTGIYQGIGKITGHLASIEETCCTFDGSDYCGFDELLKKFDDPPAPEPQPPLGKVLVVDDDPNIQKRKAVRRVRRDAL
jgi:hypothetical protein